MAEKPCWGDLESSNELSQHLATSCRGEQLYQIGWYPCEQAALNLAELPGRGREKPAETVRFPLQMGTGSPLPVATGVGREKRR